MSTNSKPLPEGKLICVSLTGADDLTPIKQLHLHQQVYPFIEWAILVCPRYEGQPRYPQRAWIERFVKEVPGQKSLHLCEESIHAFLAGDKDIHSLAAHFTRVQLNFFQKRAPVEAAAVDAAARAYKRPVIVPQNPGNAPLVAQLTAPNIQWLFDRSGGRGVAPDSWPPADKVRKCGYAGGLSPSNISQQLPRIFEAAAGVPIWADLESALRGPDGCFSFGHVQSFCDQVARLTGLRVNRDKLSLLHA